MTDAKKALMTEVVCYCQRSTVKREPGKFCGPQGEDCKGNGTYVDGKNTFMEAQKSQGYKGLLLLRKRQGLPKPQLQTQIQQPVQSKTQQSAASSDATTSASGTQTNGAQGNKSG